MSMTPNNPFEDPRYDASGVQAPAKKKGGKGCLIGCGIGSVLVLLVCCGGGGMFMQFVMSTIASEYERQLASNPVVVEHLGEVESFDFDMTATFQEAQKSGDQGGDPDIAFKVKGSKGDGTILVKQDNSGDGGAAIKSAILVLPDGSRHEIDAPADSGAADDLNIEFNELIDSGEVDAGSPEGDSGSASEGDSGSASEGDQPASPEPIEVGEN